MTPTCLIADDEPLLREHLASHLARLWPALQVVGQARNGREAVALQAQHQPDIVFLDVHMPGLSGVDAARAIREAEAAEQPGAGGGGGGGGNAGGATGGPVRRAQLVFVTAYEQYAVQAFEQGAVDYLVKPFEAARLADTVARLRERLDAPALALPAAAATAAEATAAEAAADDDGSGRIDAVLARLAARLQHAGGRAWLQWIKASVGQAVRLIPVDEVIYLRSDEKYTLVVWQGGEALIRKPIRELVDELDPESFAQVHRSVIVNLRAIAQVVRGANDTADVHLRGRAETLPVSRSFLHLFRQM
ncbi:LytR/AlgR family response regulator transcription factor [Aquabacterium sp. OR-4]|uniref:LytR/AlgR family response regulator transcription factor n=1 Tax=Aquabacterium sp. OR-4 TaxID=2978127 RepID=UPI0021B3383C|nr:response regulator transcription factor [Aquabacterium sp. OR-4]MDT7836853.1 response regulator transcription factor [Aquabacterium sp. OR-4]